MAGEAERELEGLLEGVDAALAERLRQAVTRQVEQATRAFVAKTLRLERGTGREPRLGRLSTGLWRARGLCAEELRLQLKAEGVALENSRIELHLELELGFQLPRLTSLEPRTFKAGPAPGRVMTPTVRRLDLSYLTKGMGLSFVLSSICADEAWADVAPVRAMEAPSGALSGVTIGGVRLPLGGDGALAELVLERLGLGRLGAASLRLERMGAEGELLGRDVVVRNASLPAARVGAVAGGELDLDFEVELPRMKIKSFPDLPASIRRLTTRVWVEVAPKLVVHVGNLRLEGLTLSTELGELRVAELRLPFTVSDVELLEVALEGLVLEKGAL